MCSQHKLSIGQGGDDMGLRLSDDAFDVGDRTDYHLYSLPATNFSEWGLEDLEIYRKQLRALSSPPRYQ